MPRKITSGRVGRAVLGAIVTEDNSLQSIITNANVVLDPNGTGLVETTKDFLVNNNAGIRLSDGDTNYAKIVAPASLSANYTLTLPADDGNSNQVLQTNGSGTLSWTNTALTVTNRTAADNNTYYVAMSDGTSGTEDTLSVASGRLEFIPNPGRLRSAEMRVTASTTSSSSSSGALVVTGGLGVGGATFCNALTATSITETSSIVLKENINPINNALESVLKLKGVTYDRIDNNEHESGLIAEWTEEVLPELVTRNSDGNVVGIKYTKLTAYLIEAVKSLSDEIDKLKNK
jgi:hypothetical protein